MSKVNRHPGLQHYHRKVTHVDISGASVFPLPKLGKYDLIPSFHGSKFTFPNITNGAISQYSCKITLPVRTNCA